MGGYVFLAKQKWKNDQSEKIYTLLAKLVGVCFFLLHDFYVSVSYMEYDAERNAIEIQKKIFFDDLEVAIKKSYKIDNFDIVNDDQELVNFYIEKYLLENMTPQGAA